MTVETATYIGSLNATYPTGADGKNEGDDHIRLLKTVLKATFPNLTGAVTPTHTVLNYVVNVTSDVQAQLNLKANLASPALTGGPTAPTAAASTNNTQIATTAFVQANKASPVFTGTPAAPTPGVGSNSTAIATTEFVQTALAGVGGTPTRGIQYFYGSIG